MRCPLFPASTSVPTVDVDRDTARDAAAAELAKAVYPRQSLSDQFAEWVNDLLYRLVLKGSQVPGGWFTIAVLALLALATAVAAVRIARRAIRTRATAELYGDQVLSAVQHRSRAVDCAARQDWDAAIRHRLRAVGRQLEEDGALTALPGRTATELAREAGSQLAELRGDFATAAEIFNDVSYGGRPGDEKSYRFIVDLDDRLAHHVASAAAAPPGTAGADWTPLR